MLESVWSPCTYPNRLAQDYSDGGKVFGALGRVYQQSKSCGKLISMCLLGTLVVWNSLGSASKLWCNYGWRLNCILDVLPRSIHWGSECNTSGKTHTVCILAITSAYLLNHCQMTAVERNLHARTDHPSQCNEKFAIHAPMGGYLECQLSSSCMHCTYVCI